MKTKTYRQERVKMITLGCSKNLVDSENIITQLEGNGYEVSHDESHETEIAIINTCGFIDLAKEESVNTILEYAERKKSGEVKKVYVTGCLSERYKEDLRKEIPEVDAFFGTMELHGLLQRLNADYKSELLGERTITTPSHYAYLKIAEGCNRTCAFCAIPLMRGSHVSKPLEDIIDEARNLAKIGVVELILIAQELTYYGLDLYKRRALAELLHELVKVEGIQWIRLHYAYPSKFPMEVLEVIAQEPKICNYLDIPLQHANDAVLHRMKRQITQEETRHLIERARAIIPNLTLRTTFLVGFPGETEAEYRDLVDFVKEMKFDRLGVFQYSHEEDTSGYADYIDDVPEEIKIQRTEHLMEVQRNISEDLNANKIGRTYLVLIDRIEGDYFVGRTEGDSPEVDNEVLISTLNCYLRIGDFVYATVTDSAEFDLFAEVTQDK